MLSVSHKDDEVQGQLRFNFMSFLQMVMSSQRVALKEGESDPSVWRPVRAHACWPSHCQRLAGKGRGLAQSTALTAGRQVRPHRAGWAVCVHLSDGNHGSGNFWRQRWELNKIENLGLTVFQTPICYFSDFEGRKENGHTEKKKLSTLLLFYIPQTRW